MKTFQHSLDRASVIFLCGMVRGQAERFVSMPHKMTFNRLPMEATIKGGAAIKEDGFFAPLVRKPYRGRFSSLQLGPSHDSDRATASIGGSFSHALMRIGAWVKFGGHMNKLVWLVVCFGLFAFVHIISTTAGLWATLNP